ncbi:hypothetical protein O3G_MSEX001840 [Manduca sexta]|nr:hypothetical protein O3G_MSEX001840 [Manduca sexta]
MEIYFDKEVVIYGASQDTSFRVKRNTWQHYVIRPKGRVPKRYVFYIQIQNCTAMEDDTPTVSQFKLNNVTLCDNAIKASYTVKSFNVTEEFAGASYAHVCGRRSLNHTEFTSVRTEALAGDWPWHVAILINKVNKTVASYDCGGSIISKTAVITAGHCVFENNVLLEPHRLVVIAGVNNYKDLLQVGRQLRTATDIVLHPNYQNEYATADLAIIKVNSFVYTEFVQPICIWGPVYDKTNLFGKEATVVGFGSTEDDKQSEILRSAYTVVQNDTICIKWAPNIYGKLLNEFTFCAGYGPKSSINPRNGDSGGGLVVKTIQPDHKISWFLRGVLSKCGVSPGKKDCDPTYYVVYTDVGPHYGWIYHHSGLEYRNNIKSG